MSADRQARIMVDRLDEIAAAMERKWGIDRLPRIVPADLALKFGAQAAKLDEAIESNRPDAIAAQAAAMERAWAALDAAAIAAKAQPLSPIVWEVQLPKSNEVVAIVRTLDEAAAVRRDRDGAVFTLDEVAIALEAFGDQVREAKELFPGATVTDVRSKAPRTGGPRIGEARKRFALERRREKQAVPGWKEFDWERGDADLGF